MWTGATTIGGGEAVVAGRPDGAAAAAELASTIAAAARAWKAPQASVPDEDEGDMPPLYPCPSDDRREQRQLMTAGNSDS